MTAPGEQLLAAAIADERLARAAWSRLAEPGDKRLAHLIASVGASTALVALLEREVPWMAKYLARIPQVNPGRDIESIHRLGGRLIIPGDSQWPPGCAALAAPPICLWAQGPLDVDQLSARSVAVVGARAASTYGEHMARELAYELAEREYVVVSGMAFGIDAAAHRAALLGGLSAAILAGGLDRAYPAAHDSLQRQLSEQGVVCSEVPVGVAPTRSRFLLRNRLIAAITGGTVVVEAALRSGALNTARTAGELGRPVAAVPGAATSMTSAGCHQLIRSGQATLVTSAAEVIDLIGQIGPDAAVPPRGLPRASDALDQAQLQVMDTLGRARGRPLDRICADAGLSPQQAQSALGCLLALGLVERQAGGWRRVPKTP